jgi:hypothetical protein
MELKHADNPIEHASPEMQVMSNLFYGWGYNFYRKENQLRADDLLIRGKISDMLGAARAHLARMESDWRREHLPPPSREHPFPDASAVAVAQSLERAQKDIEAIEVGVRNAGVPEMDRVDQRHRDERGTLARLADADLALAVAVKAAVDRIESLDRAENAAVGARDALHENRIAERLSERGQILSVLDA